MPRAVIRSNRSEVSGRFRLLGFTVRTGANPFFEVAMATDPALFADKTRRTPNTFYSTRALGPLPAEGDEAIYIVPDDVLRRFVGQERLYYAVATFPDRTRTKADVATLPPDAMPFVTISRSFTGRALRQTVGTGTRVGGGTSGSDAYTSENGASLEWAGDEVRPGAEPAAPTSNSGTTTNGNGKPGGNHTPPPATASSFGADAPYDDGYSNELWSDPRSQTTKRSRSLSAASFDIGWADVDVVPQVNNVTCWAAAAAMIVGWRDRISVDPTEVARGAGPWARYIAGLSLTDVRSFADAWQLDVEEPQSYSVDAFRQLIETRGPLWVAAHVPGLHAIVVTGIYGDGTPDGTYVRINDPWSRLSGTPGAPGAYNPTPGQGSQYVLTYRQLAAEFESAGSLPDADVQILHAKERDMAGRSPLVTSQAFSLWQSVESRRPRDARAMAVPAVVPIASAIVGAVMNRILNNEGDVHWELDQLQGIKHPGNDPANAGAGAFSTTTTPVAGWPYVENLATDRISADFEIRWQFNGRSLGNVEISNTATNDAVGWGLDVKANIMDDAIVHDGKAAVRVRFYYRFNRSIGSDIIAISDYTLFGDGTFTRSSRWTQGGPEAQSLALGPGRRNDGHAPTRALAAPIVVPIVAAFVGAVATRVFNNEGDIKWELDQAAGMKHVDDNAANRGPLAPTWKTIAVEDWPYISNKIDDWIYADFEIRFQYDGRSVGNISITNTKTNDAVGWGLEVKAQIMNDAAAYTRGSGDSFAAVKVQFYYRFDRAIGSDSIAITDFTLYGDGSYSKSSRWTQY